MTWFHFYARQFGIPRREYLLMTTGEIEDLVACKAITSGAMDEVIEYNGSKLPDLR